MRYERGAVDAPCFARLGENFRAEIVAASAALPGLAPVLPEAIEQAPDGLFFALRHDLSEHYVALNGTPTPAPRSAKEMEVLTWLAAGSEDLRAATAEAFRASLAEVNRRLTDGAGGWRGGAIRLGGDRAGNRVYFPPVCAMDAQLDKLRVVLADEADHPPLFRGVVAYALLLNAHPFSDGNGRTARLILNYVLREGGMHSNVYLPLYEIAHRSLGGHDIALRTAELRGDWEPIFGYFLSALQCCWTLSGSSGWATNFKNRANANG
jgi:hypothetical protein